MRQFSERRISIKGVDEMRELGLELAAALEPGDIIAMVGNLGTGKTTLSKYIAEGLGVTEALLLILSRSTDREGFRSFILMSTDSHRETTLWTSERRIICTETAYA